MTDCGVKLILGLVYGTSLLLLSLQISVFASLRYLQTAVEAAMDLENKEGDSEGYLLEKGVKDTLEDLKANMLKILQFGQVDPTAEESPEAPATDKAATDDASEKAADPAPSS